MNLPVPYDSLDWKQRRVVRQQYVKEQKGVCWHCGLSLKGPASQDVLAYPLCKHTFPTNFFKHRIHLHHSHTTGLTVGAVHAECNAVLFHLHGQ